LLVKTNEELVQSTVMNAENWLMSTFKRIIRSY